MKLGRAERPRGWKHSPTRERRERRRGRTGSITLGEFLAQPTWAKILAILAGVRVGPKEETVDEPKFKVGDLVRVKDTPFFLSGKICFVDQVAVGWFGLRGAVPYHGVSMAYIEPVSDIRAGDRVRATANCSEGAGRLETLAPGQVAEIEEGENANNFKIMGVYHSRECFEPVAHDEPLTSIVAKVASPESWEEQAKRLEAQCDDLHEERDRAMNELAEVKKERDVAYLDRDAARRGLISASETFSFQVPIPVTRGPPGQQKSKHAAETTVLDAMNNPAAELALEREHVSRLKLALSQALPPGPPASILERIATRVRVEGAALARGGWSLAKLVAALVVAAFYVPMACLGHLVSRAERPVLMTAMIVGLAGAVLGYGLILTRQDTTSQVGSPRSQATDTASLPSEREWDVVAKDTYRLRIPEGFLYRANERHVALVFVPDNGIKTSPPIDCSKGSDIAPTESLSRGIKLQTSPPIGWNMDFATYVWSTRGGSTSFTTNWSDYPRNRVEILFPGNREAERCWHCGHSLEAFKRPCQWGGELRITQDGGDLFSGCCWCLAERLKRPLVESAPLVHIDDKMFIYRDNAWTPLKKATPPTSAEPR